MNFADLVFHHALTQPLKPALILPDRLISYGMMAQSILLVEDRLRRLELPAGSLVSVALPSPARHMIVAAALARLGMTQLAIRRAADFAGLDLPVALHIAGAPETPIPGLNQIVAGEDWFDGPVKPITAAPARAFADDRVPFLVSLSSGTTGRPKAVAVSENGFDQRLRHSGFSIGRGLWDRMLCLPAMSTIWGFTLAAHALHAGKTLVFARTALDTMRMIALFGVDCLACSIGDLQELVAAQRQLPMACPSLRVVFTGGSLASRGLLSEAASLLCTHIVVQYGSTEAGGTAFAPAARLEAEGAAGFVAPWATVDIVDEAGTPLPPGAEGIVRVRTVGLGQSYPDAASRDGGFRDGWFYPGDVGRLSREGLLILAGRRSEIINAGGNKVAPETVEEIVRRHPLVADAAAVAGRNAAGIEELWLALVAPAPIAADEIAALFAGQRFSPDRVFTVERIPRNQMGKVERETLKQALAGETGAPIRA